MEKKIFNKLTKEIFLEYGFVKNKNNYILNLDYITIVVNFCSWRGVKSFNYYFYINDLYDDSIPFQFNRGMFTEIKMEHSPELPGYKAHEILFEKYTEMEYAQLLKDMLYKYFEPYKKDAIKFIKDNESLLLLTEETKKYFNIF